jgi:predicted N-formylglutamate amidohydrolase
MAQKLLAADEPAAVTTYDESGSSPLLLVADHAGNIMPRSLGRLGIETAECEQHVAWDIGIAGLARILADALDATLMQQNYSRLVIDCNRPPEVATSIPEISELTPIPGNVGLSEAGRAARMREIFTPYHERIGAALDRRKQDGRATVLVALHSFTPVFKGVTRPWHVGVMYNRDPRFAREVLALLRKEPGLVVGDQEPYAVSDTSDYTIPVHGERRGLPHVLIEIRQDLIADKSGQRAWALILARLLPRAYAAFAAEEPARPADRRE